MPPAPVLPDRRRGKVVPDPLQTTRRQTKFRYQPPGNRRKWPIGEFEEGAVCAKCSETLPENQALAGEGPPDARQRGDHRPDLPHFRWSENVAKLLHIAA